MGFSLVAVVDSGYHEKRLLNYLFDANRRDAHNLLERPVENDTEPLEVLFKATLQQIIDVVSIQRNGTGRGMNYDCLRLLFFCKGAVRLANILGGISALSI